MSVSNENQAPPDSEATKASRAGMGRRLGWSSVTEVLQLVSSVMVFLVLPRFLSTADFGTLGAVLGVAFPTASLSSFGTHILLMKRAAQGFDLGQAWARALSLGVLGPAVGAGIALFIVRPLYLSSIDPWVFGLLVVSQVNFFWVGELATFIGVGTRRLKESAHIRMIVVVARLAALAAFGVWGGGSLIFWAAAGLVAFAVSASGAVLYVWKVFGLRPSLRRATRSDVIEGLPYSVNSGSESLVDAVDKPMLAHYDHLADAGIYSLGTRIIQFGYLPIRILLRANDADVFEAGKKGVAEAWAVTRSRLLLPGVGVSLVVGGALLVLAPLVPIVLGSDYRDSVGVIRFLAVLPGARSIQYLLGNCLSASSYQWWRVRATMGAVGVNVGLNVWLLPTGGWRTAVGTTLVSEVLLAFALAGVVFFLSRRENSGRFKPGSASA